MYREEDSLGEQDARYVTQHYMVRLSCGWEENDGDLIWCHKGDGDAEEESEAGSDLEVSNVQFKAREGLTSLWGRPSKVKICKTEIRLSRKSGSIWNSRVF